MSQVAAFAADTKGDMRSDDQNPLHVYLRDQGRVLSTRPRGREAADQLRVVADEPGDLILDFEGVEVASPPFLQEIVEASHALVRRDKDTGRIVLFANMNEDVAETMRYVVAKRKLTLAYREGDQIQLLEAKPHLVATLRTAQQLRSFTAPELAERMDIEKDAATHRLRKLLETGAVVREPDPEARQGIRHLYRVASPDLTEVAGRRGAGPRKVASKN
jgi:DNA-binding transcriptional ArsR family regulator